MVGVMMCVEGVGRRVCRRYLDIRVGGGGKEGHGKSVEREKKEQRVGRETKGKGDKKRRDKERKKSRRSGRGKERREERQRGKGGKTKGEGQKEWEKTVVYKGEMVQRRKKERETHTVSGCFLYNLHCLTFPSRA